jgi:hypothetical protein
MFEDYYLSQKNRLMGSFDRLSMWVMTPLVERCGEELSQVILERARKDYEALIPRIPFIGGKRNRWTADLIRSAQILALFRAMRAFGRTPSETAEVLYEGTQIRLARYPRFWLHLMGRWHFSSWYVKRVQRHAAETHKHEFPDNFVADVVTGDGKEFDWGIDFTECAIQKFYRAQNALQFLPYVCRLNHFTNADFGFGMARTKTLANGDELCNPRLWRGRATQRKERSE